MTFSFSDRNRDDVYDENDPTFAAPERHIASYINKRTVEDALATTWHDFAAQAEMAQIEVKRYGAPRSETTSALSYLSDTITLLEQRLTQATLPAGTLLPVEQKGELSLNGQRYSYAKGTAEQARFMQALRGGLASLPEYARDRVRLADDEWLSKHSDSSKAMTQASDVTGGFLAAPEFSADLLRAMQNASPVRQVATVKLTGGTGALVPVRSGIQTASRVAESATRVSTSDDLSFKLDQVPVHEMYTLTQISRAMLADSHYALDQELVSGAAAAFGLLEGSEFIKGTGNGEFLGLNSASNIPAANLVACADGSGHLVTPDDILKLVYKSMGAQYIPGARLLMNPKMLGTLRALKATSGNTFLAPVMDSPGTFMGIPVTLVPDLADNATPAANNVVAYFIHPLAYAVVVREDMVVQRLVERFADIGQVGYSIYSRTGGQIVLPEAVARLTTA
jgi:HK97 family phage major capsid protein